MHKETIVIINGDIMSLDETKEKLAVKHDERKVKFQEKKKNKLKLNVKKEN